MREWRRSVGRSWARIGCAAALGAVIVPAGVAGASRFPAGVEQRREESETQRFRAYRIAWRQSVTERGLLEFQPRELGGPAIESFSGDLVVSNRRGKIRLLDGRGRQIWVTSVGAAPTSTPTLTEDAIFVGTADGMIHSIDRFNGEHLWSQRLDAQVLSPPVALHDRIIVGTDHDAVHALDIATGETLWVYRRSTPTQLSIRGGTGVAVEGERLFAGFSDGALVALGAEDGRLLWQTASPGSLEKFPDSDAAPVVREGTVYATVFNDGVHAYDAATGKLRWRADAQGAHSLAFAGELVLVGGARNALGLHAGTGAKVWSIDLGSSWVGRPVVTEQIALLPGPEGIAMVVAETGKPLGRFFPGSGFSAPPAAQGSDVYAFSDLGYLYRLEIVAGPR